MFRSGGGVSGPADPGPAWPAAAMLLAVVAASLACLYAIHTTGLMSSALWLAPAASAGLAAALALGICLLVGIARRSSTAFSMLLCGAIVLFAGVYAGIGATATVLLQLAAGFCLGRRLIGNAVERECPAQPASGVLLSAVLATATGLALLSLIVTGLSFLPVNTPVTYAVVLLAPLVIGWRRNGQAFAQLLQAWRAPAAEPLSPWMAMGMVLVALAIMIRLLAALRPEIGADALAMHLVIADQLKTNGFFPYNAAQSIWAVEPMAADWQVAIAHMLSGSTAASLLNVAADLLLVALVYLTALRAGGRQAAVIAALVYATTPLLYRETSSLFIENFWTLWCMSALLLGLTSLRNAGMRLPIAAGLLLGTAMASKVITLFLLPFFIAIAVVWLRRAPRQGLRNLALSGAVAGIAGLPPYLNAWLRTGNPVFPFFNNVFKSPLFDSHRAFNNTLFNQPMDWTLLHDVTFHSDRYLEAVPGALGLSFYVLLPATLIYALVASWRTRIGIACAFLFVLGVFHFQSYLRYILPVIPVFAVLIGLGVAYVIVRLPKARFLLIPVLATTTLASLYLTPTSNHQLRDLVLPPLPGSPARDVYLRQRRPSYGLVQFIASTRPKHVLWIGKPHIAGAGTDIQVTNWHGGRGAQEFARLRTASALAQWLLDNHFDAVAVALNANPCERKFICDFFDDSTRLVYNQEGTSLRLIEPSALHRIELLANPGFDADTKSWNGNGTYVAADQAVIVSNALQLTQAISIKGGTAYVLEVEGRCTADRGSYRLQINWQGAASKLIRANIDVVQCDTAFISHAMLVTAPSDAVAAVIHLQGQDPGKTAEITHVSFRNNSRAP